MACMPGINFAWPEEPDHTELTDDAVSINSNLKNALARLDALADRDESGELIEKAIKLSPEARKEFEQFRQFVHEERRSLDGREREWMAEPPSHVLRLAGTLCLLDWAWDAEPGAEPNEIDTTCVKRAIKLVSEYFWPHARAALRLAGLSERHAAARRALRWIKMGGLKKMSLLNVRREALSHSLDEVGTKELLDSLGRGWLASGAEAREPAQGPGRPALRWDCKSHSLGWQCRKCRKCRNPSRRLCDTTGTKRF